MERTELIARSNPGSLVVEAYRNVRNVIRAAGAELKIIEITGAVPDTEKSVFTANLAVVMAQAGKRILLIDCDSANPSQHTLFQLNNRGLSEAAASGNDVRALCQETGQVGLDLLAAGPGVLSDLLSSERFSQLLDGLKASYDYILLDAPAVLAGADASALAVCADGVVLVVESEKEEPKTVQLAKKRLNQAKANILGCVLNNMKVDRRYDEFFRMWGDVA